MREGIDKNNWLFKPGLSKSSLDYMQDLYYESPIYKKVRATNDFKLINFVEAFYEAKGVKFHQQRVEAARERYKNLNPLKKIIIQLGKNKIERLKGKEENLRYKYGEVPDDLVENRTWEVENSFGGVSDNEEQEVRVEAF